MLRWSHIFCVILCVYTLRAEINSHSDFSRILINDTAGKDKLVLGSDIGSASNPYTGVIELSDAYFPRRIEDRFIGDGTNQYWYLKNALVITGTPQAYVSARYDSEAEDADVLDRYTMINDSNSGLSFARFEPGTELRELVIGNGANSVGTAYIQGAPIFAKPIRMAAITAAGAPHVVRWGLTGKLNQSIVLPTISGNITSTTQFVLDSNLQLGDGVAFLPSTGNYPARAPELLITFSNSRLSLGGQDLTWRSTLLLEKAQDVELNANLNLDATWLFSGNAMIQGNGNVLDISGRDANTSGTIGFDSSALINNQNTTTLFLRDIKLRLRNGALFTHERTVLDLSNVEIELENTVNFTSGNIHISGPTMIYSKNHTFSISHGATMTVDGTVLYYDSGQHYNTQGVYPSDALADDKTVMGEALNFQHDGYVQKIKKPQTPLVVTPGGISGQVAGNVTGAGTSGNPYVFTLDEDLWLSEDVQLIFENVTGGATRFYLFNGNNHFVHFTPNQTNVIFHDLVDAHFVNTIFKNWDPAVFFRNATSTSDPLSAVNDFVRFGQGCVCELGHDVFIGDTPVYRILFTISDDVSFGNGTPGNENIVTINGNGHHLFLPYRNGQGQAGQLIFSDGDASGGARLEIENTVLNIGGWPREFRSDNGSVFHIQSDFTSTLLLRNTQVDISNLAIFRDMNIMIEGNVSWNNTQTNRDDTDGDGDEDRAGVVYWPEREAVLTVSHNSTMRVNRDVRFHIGVGHDVFNPPGLYGDHRRILQLFDHTSTLHLDGCRFFVGRETSGGGQGLDISKGTINIENRVRFQAKDDEDRTLFDTTPGNELTVNIFAGATLEIESSKIHYANK